MAGLDLSDGLPRVVLKNGHQYFLVTEDGVQKSYRLWFQTSYDIANMSNTGYLRTVMFRGKNLGDHVTDAQWNAIKVGTFDDMFLGDYWDINGHLWTIVDFNYWRRRGNTSYQSFDTPHVVLAAFNQDNIFGGVKMNDAATTVGGFVAMKLYKEYIPNTLCPIIYNDFGSDHIVSCEHYFSNVVTDGDVTGGIWASADAIIPNEMMIFGGRNYSSRLRYSAIVDSVDNIQLAYFKMQSFWMPRRKTWLYDVVSPTQFACISNVGGSTRTHANDMATVMPIFAICG